MTDQVDPATHPSYYAWRQALASGLPVDSLRAVPGYYRCLMTGGDIPVAVFYGDEEHPDGLVARMGFEEDARDATDLTKLWPSLWRRPIPDSLYWSAYEAGAWPEAAPEPVKAATPDDWLDIPRPSARDPGYTDAQIDRSQAMIGAILGTTERAEALPDFDTPPDRKSNNPPPDNTPEHFREQADNALGVVKDLIEDGVVRCTTEDDAQRAMTASERLRMISQTADAHRKIEKKPWDDKVAEVQLRWQRPVVDYARNLSSAFNAAAKDWLKREERRLMVEAAQREEAARNAREAAEKAVREAQEAAAVALATDGEIIDVPALPPPERVLVEKPPLLGGAVSGRRSGLKKVRVWKIVDRDKFWAAIQDRPDSQEFADTVAARIAASRSAPPEGLTVGDDTA